MTRGPMPRCRAIVDGASYCDAAMKRVYIYDGRQGQRRWVLVGNYCPRCKTFEAIP
jgi:hypothetical protein